MELIYEAPAVHAEDDGRLIDVAFGLIKCFFQHLPFECRYGVIQRHSLFNHAANISHTPDVYGRQLQVAAGNYAALAEYDGPLNTILEVANVPGPVVFLQNL